jgi:rhamnulokinase
MVIAYLHEAMDNFYVACDLGVEHGRVLLGTLRKGQLTISEVHHFKNLPIEEKSSRLWDIQHLYREILTGLREIGTFNEPINSISCHSWGGDYMLFDPDGSLSTPVYNHPETRLETGGQEIFAKISPESLYGETGVIPQPGDTLFQLAIEKSRRLNHAGQLLPVADGFNYLLSGTPRVEMSSAGTTQLFNPLTKEWSERMLFTCRLPAKLFPAIAPAGTKLGMLREATATETKLEDVQVIASCSHEISAALAGLPVGPNECWAFIRPGTRTLIGTELNEPIISDAARELQFTNQIGYGGSVNFHKPTLGLWILEECEQFWKESDHNIDRNMLVHFAGESTPFESLLDLTDPRFHTTGDMPLKIQTYCRETDQAVPRKPGPMIRCLLESLALLYRKNLAEMESLTGRKITKLYVLEGQEISLLNHFIANALQVPVVVVSPGSGAAGNMLVQALAQGHVKSLEEARQVLRSSIKTKTIAPHASNWGQAFEKLSFSGERVQQKL